MKHGSFKATCLILVMACIGAVTASGDENTVRLMTKVLESFNGESSSYTWAVEGSKFTYKPDPDNEKEKPFIEEYGEKPFPRSSFVGSDENFRAYPTAAYKEPVESFGIWGKFVRRGYNWFDVYPEAKKSDTDADGKEVPELTSTKGIPIPGRIQYLDMWVWGSNLKYSLEAYFRDYNGVIHVINLGSINHTGWKNLRAAVPGNVPQSKTVLPRLAALEFIKFRIWTEPNERVDNFYIYFNRFNILYDDFETPYDGDVLADQQKVQDFWKGGN